MCLYLSRRLRLVLRWDQSIHYAYFILTFCSVLLQVCNKLVTDSVSYWVYFYIWTRPTIPGWGLQLLWSGCIPHRCARGYPVSGYSPMRVSAYGQWLPSSFIPFRSCPTFLDKLAYFPWFSTSCLNKLDKASSWSNIDTMQYFLQE